LPNKSISYTKPTSTHASLLLFFSQLIESCVNLTLIFKEILSRGAYAHTSSHNHLLGKYTKMTNTRTKKITKNQYKEVKYLGGGAFGQVTLYEWIGSPPDDLAEGKHFNTVIDQHGTAHHLFAIKTLKPSIDRNLTDDPEQEFIQEQITINELSKDGEPEEKCQHIRGCSIEFETPDGNPVNAILTKPEIYHAYLDENEHLIAETANLNNFLDLFLLNDGSQSLIGGLEETLTTAFKKDSLTIIVKMLSDIHEGIHQIHRKGYVHRDIRLDNIFVGLPYGRQNNITGINVTVGDVGQAKKKNTDGWADKLPDTGALRWYNQAAFTDRKANDHLDFFSFRNVIFEIFAKLTQLKFDGDIQDVDMQLAAISVMNHGDVFTMKQYSNVVRNYLSHNPNPSILMFLDCFETYIVSPNASLLETENEDLLFTQSINEWFLQNILQKLENPQLGTDENIIDFLVSLDRLTALPVKFEHESVENEIFQACIALSKSSIQSIKTDKEKFKKQVEYIKLIPEKSKKFQEEQINKEIIKLDKHLHETIKDVETLLATPADKIKLEDFPYSFQSKIKQIKFIINELKLKVDKYPIFTQQIKAIEQTLNNKESTNNRVLEIENDLINKKIKQLEDKATAYSIAYAENKKKDQDLIAYAKNIDLLYKIDSIFTEIKKLNPDKQIKIESFNIEGEKKALEEAAKSNIEFNELWVQIQNHKIIDTPYHAIGTDLPFVRTKNTRQMIGPEIKLFVDTSISFHQATNNLQQYHELSKRDQLLKDAENINNKKHYLENPTLRSFLNNEKSDTEKIILDQKKNRYLLLHQVFQYH